MSSLSFRPTIETRCAHRCRHSKFAARDRPTTLTIFSLLGFFTTKCSKILGKVPNAYEYTLVMLFTNSISYQLHIRLANPPDRTLGDWHRSYRLSVIRRTAP